MKFVNFKIKPIIFLIFVSILFIKNTNSSFLENSNLNTLEESSPKPGTGFQGFLVIAKKHMSPQEGSCPDSNSCRSLEEVLYIAYRRNKILEQELKTEKSSLASAHPYLNKEGVTRVVFTAPALLGKSSKNVPGVPLYKVCIPTDRNFPSYMDYNCPMTPCPITKEESLKCKDDPNTISKPKIMSLDLNNLALTKRK